MWHGASVACLIVIVNEIDVLLMEYEIIFIIESHEATQLVVPSRASTETLHFKHLYKVIFGQDIGACFARTDK